ncbi:MULTISPECIES: nucleotidyltransferase family protein [Clostridium]|uniref:nucleotidyltransferase family protein n=1 Tax=Clostridium TaxID=1485 RepID=UPI001E4A4E0B|nr:MULTISPECIES: nucleotidyltransferase domain-containing protein [Clostridium]MDU4478955.1 nucleotidyltransferase domain-containing protein [Clostridium sp.]
MEKEKIEKIILETLPQDKTEAIYIFGSYNTQFFHDDSDIDIGWFCNNVSEEERVLLEYELEQKIGREVDLVFPNKNKILILNEILAGKPIGRLSKHFCQWFDNNIDEIMYISADLISMM